MIFRPLEGLRSSYSLGLSPLQSKVDGLVSRFVAEAAEPRTLAALASASFAYRTARAATASRFWSIPFAFSCEVGVFELNHRLLQSLKPKGPSSLKNQSSVADPPSSNRWSWSGQGGIFRGLLSTGITFGILKGSGFLIRDQNLIYQHLFQASAAVLGHQFAGILALIPRPEGSLAEQLLHAETTALQLMVGMGMVHQALPRFFYGPFLENFSFPWDRPGSTFSLATFRPFLNKAAFSSSREIRLYHFLSKSRGLPSPERAERLKQTFKPHFPPEGPESYTDVILEKTLKIPSDHPHFHERLLEALSQSQEKGTYSQALTVEALRHVFSRNAIENPAGSFDNALLQLLIGEIIRDSSPLGRNQAFFSLFEAMGGGLSRGKILQIFLKRGYGKGWALSKRDLGRNPWIQFQIEEALEAGKFNPQQVDHALDYAQGHPFGKLIVRRMLQVFAVDDIPAKLKDLAPQDSSSILDRVLTLLQRGLPPEAVAEQINGTFQTAFIEDMRLARKAVSIYQSLFEAQIQTDLKQNRRRFEEPLIEFLFGEDPWSPEIMMDLIRTNPEERAESLRQEWETGCFKIEILSDRAFDELLGRWGKSASKYSLFDQRDDRILIRELPPMSLTTALGRYTAFHQVLGRLKGLIHEGEHWRHTSGNYRGIEKYSDPIDLGNIGRQDRLVSETMAYLEEYLWAFRNFDDDFGGIALRLGENLPLYFRNLADEAYFRKTNERLLTEWWRQLPDGF